jgi:excinuclease ABC subunit C
VQVLTRLYRLRSCEGHAPGRSSGSPCLDFHIRRCDAPCVGFISTEEYGAAVARVRAVLEGNWQEMADELEMRMLAASAKSFFEDAARWRDDFQVLQRLCGRDVSTIFTRTREADAIAIAVDGESAHLQLLRVRDHTLAGRDRLILENIAGLDEHALTREAVLRAYAQTRAAPVVALACVPTDNELVERLLSNNSHHKVRTRVPARGELVRLLDLATRNAEATRARVSVSASASAVTPAPEPIFTV